MCIKYAVFEKGLRYYSLVLEKDLFEDWTITRRYGGKGMKGCHEIKEGYSLYQDAKKRFDYLFEYRIKQRKYKVFCNNFNIF